LKDPLIVNSLFLKKPERIEALGLVLLLALLLWRLVERTLRVHVETTGQPLTGGDKKATQKPTAFMMMTKFAGVMVLKVGGQRQLAHPLSPIQQQDLVALRVSATYFPALQSGSRDAEGHSRSPKFPGCQRGMSQTKGERPLRGGQAAPPLHPLAGAPETTPM
jgi:hypothetical protein